jgi:hypothetical protein
MNNLCMSAAGPCDQLCDVCKQAHEKYLHDHEQQVVTQAIRVLESMGYQIIPPSKLVNQGD